jgi:phage portal protein BeeE
VLKAVPPDLRRQVGYQLATKADKPRDWLQENGYNRLQRALGGLSSYTGTTITLDSAFESAAFYAGCKIIGEDVGRLPFVLFRKSEDGRGQIPAADHPVYPILKNLWNPEVASGEGVEALTVHAIVTGNGWAKKVRDSRDRIVWLFPIQPGNIRIETTREGQTIYFVRDDVGLEEKSISREDLFRLNGHSEAGTSGIRVDACSARICWEMVC